MMRLPFGTGSYLVGRFCFWMMLWRPLWILLTAAVPPGVGGPCVNPCQRAPHARVG